jgi:V/A-type H+/Na+-transporting ATPase subunit E
MSVTIEDKIELFSKLIFGNIEEKSSEKRQRLAETHRKELETLKLDMEKRKKELMETATVKAEREKIKLIAQAKNQQQQMLVQQKQRAMQSIMKKLQELAADFTNTQDYKVYMEKNVESLIKTLDRSKQITFYVMEKDQQLTEGIVVEKLNKANRQVRFEIKKVSNNIIGGIIAEDMEELLQLDLTIIALIDENRDTVGAAITRRFNEVSSL